MHVLIVEDEHIIASHLKRGFTSEAISSTWIDKAEDLDLFINSDLCPDPEAIVLDRLLGSVDLSTWIPRLRDRWPTVRILVLSAVGGPKERAAILDLGADDYMNKPFDFTELMSRLRVITLRPARAQQEANVKWNSEIQLNELIQDIEVSGQRLGLSRKEYLLARTLLENPNRVFSRYKLLDMVWDVHSEVESNVVEVTISHIRQKFKLANTNLKIQSRRNTGYWLET